MGIILRTFTFIRRLLVILFFIVGIAILVYGILNIRSAAKYKKWPMAHGFIIDNAATAPEMGTEGKTPKSNFYTVNIVYEYFVHDMTYYSTNISSFGYDMFLPSKAYYSGSIEKIKDVLDKYAIGDGIPVYYDPDNPQDSVIDPGLKAPVFLPAVLGILLMMISFHLYFFSSFYHKKNRNQTGD